jgi:hypothetical protein
MVQITFATEEEAKIARLLICYGRAQFKGTGYEEHVADRIVSDIVHAVDETYNRAEGSSEPCPENTSG